MNGFITDLKQAYPSYTFIQKLELLITSMNLSPSLWLFPVTNPYPIDIGSIAGVHVGNAVSIGSFVSSTWICRQDFL